MPDKHDWLAVGIDVPSVKYLKSKFPGHELVNLYKLKKSSNGDLSDHKLFGVAKKVADVLAAQGARKHRIYLTDKFTRSSRAKLGRQLGATGLVILSGKSENNIERLCSFEPFEEIAEVTYDYVSKKLTLIKLKGR